MCPYSLPLQRAYILYPPIALINQNNNNKNNSFMGYLLSARHCAKYFTNAVSLNHHKKFFKKQVQLLANCPWYQKKDSGLNIGWLTPGIILIPKLTVHGALAKFWLTRVSLSPPCLLKACLLLKEQPKCLFFYETVLSQNSSLLLSIHINF